MDISLDRILLSFFAFFHVSAQMLRAGDYEKMTGGGATISHNQHYVFSGEGGRHDAARILYEQRRAEAGVGIR